MDDLLQLSDAALASGADLEQALEETEAAAFGYMDSLGSEDTEASPSPLTEEGVKGSRTWSFAGSIGRFSKRISRRDGKTLNTPTINAPIKRQPMSLEADAVDTAVDTGYISHGNPGPRRSPVTELDLPLPEEDFDAEWKDIHRFLSTVGADADNDDHRAPINNRDPGPLKRQGSRRASLV